MICEGQHLGKRKNLEKIVGNLAFAIWVAPFGNPFISNIANFIDR